MYVIKKEQHIDLSCNMLNKEGGLLEYSEGALSLYVLLPNMTKEESILLNDSRIFVRIFSGENGFMIPLFRFGNQNFIMESTFDYTKYTQDNRVDGVLESNLLTILGVDSMTSIVKVIRMSSLPGNFYFPFVQNCLKALYVDNFSEKYNQWIDSVYREYDTLKLWEAAKPCGTLGEQEK